MTEMKNCFVSSLFFIFDNFKAFPFACTLEMSAKINKN